MLKLNKFLKERTVENRERPITHTSMMVGKYHIPLQDNKEFLDLYYEALQKNKPMHLIECFIPGKLIRFVVDVELRPEFRAGVVDSAVKKKIMPCILRELHNAISMNVPNRNANIQPVVSMRAPYLAHINYPGVVISLSTAKKIVLDASLSLNISFPEVNWTKALDSGIYYPGKGMRILGSYSKKVLLQGEKPAYSPVDSNFEYVEITREHLEQTVVRTEIEDERSVTSHEVEIANDDSAISAFMSEIGNTNEFKEYDMHPVSVKRIVYPDSAHPFYSVSVRGKHCPFIGRKHKRESYPLYVWISRDGAVMKCHDEECSGKSYPDKCVPLNEEISLMYNMSLLSVDPGLGKDELQLVENIINNDGKHYDVAKLFYLLYKDRFRVDLSLNKSDRWYEFKDHKFKAHSNTVNILLSEDMVDYLNKFRNDANAGEIDKVTGNLKTTPYKANIVNEAANIFGYHHDDFVRNMDNNVNLICFNNGVLDLETMTFRDGNVDDCITLCTRNDYIPYDETSEIVKKVYEFFSSVFRDKNVMDYQLKKMARCLYGKSDQEFNIWTGNGANGKSIMCLLIQTAFGDYWCESPVSLVTRARKSSSEPSPEVMRLKGKRVTTMQEPENKDHLNMGLIKQFTGSDNISARGLYRSQEEFTLQTKLFLSCNRIPCIDTSDGGSWRRIKVVEFESKFVDNPTKEHEFKRDNNLELEVRRWGPYFMSILVHYYKKIKTEGIREPKKVAEYTKEVRRDYDMFAQFVEDVLDESDSDITPFVEIYNCWTLWTDQNGVKANAYTKTEVKKYVSDVFGREKVKKLGDKYVSGYMLKINTDL